MTAPSVGATRLEHLEDALAAVELALDEKEIRRLEEPYLPHSVPGRGVVEADSYDDRSLLKQRAPAGTR